MDTLPAALETARQSYVASNPKSREAFNEAAQNLPGGGTRSSIFVHPFPLFISHGRGPCLVDVDGHEYMDFVSDFTSGIYGKTNRTIRDAVVTALDNGLQLGAHTALESKLAEQIKKRFPSMELLRMANSGTEANMLAIATAIKFTGRSKVLVFEGGYHGSLLSHFVVDQLGEGDPAGVRGQERELESNVLTAPFDLVVSGYNDLAHARALVTSNSTSIAAIVVEPMLGAGGCIPGDHAFLRGLQSLAKEVGALLIFDEVQTARLGYGGMQQKLGIVPDLTTLGKFFGGGFAFGSFGGRKEIMSIFDSRRSDAVSHGGTFNNSPCTMAAGAAALEFVATGSALDDLNHLGDEMRTAINRIASDLSVPYKMTGLGSINQIHCTLASGQKTIGMDLLFFKLLHKGYWIAQRGLISLNFALGAADVDNFVSAMRRCFEEVCEVL